MENSKFLSVEFFVSVLIGFLLLLTLIFERFIGLFATYIFITLLLVLLLIKISHIIKKEGTVFEDYGSVFMILLLAVLRFITVESKINTPIVVVSIVIIFYTVGLIPSISYLKKSKSVISFISSYIIFMLVTISLFAGIYSINSTEFVVHAEPAELTFKDSMYFSTMTFTTVGYGDIAPKRINKLISSIEAILGIALNIGFIGYILASKRFKKD
jgi:hypothetical protein